MDLITGLPVHVLVIHAVIVLVPLAAIGALLVVFIPKLRRTYNPLVLVAILISAVSAYVATESGEALSGRVGLPKSHATLGERLFQAVLVFAVLFIIWFVMERSDQLSSKLKKKLSNTLKVFISIAAIGSITLTVLAGHSGAEASWKYRIDKTQATQDE